ncbi:MAG: exodeoxyribonuclease V subunit gamma [Chitinivibrionales bacterium]|nr:exodeoxyribonuclease V subunit gamma [Chitinivibrionales bacterium]
MTPGFYLYTSNHLERLAERLADTLAREPLGPMLPEVVLVQSMGMKRWVSLQLARHLGACANVSFPFPNAFVHRVFSLFVEWPSDPLAYNPATLTWRLADLLPELIEEPELVDIRAYLGDNVRGVKAFQLCRRLADLFDQYMVFRPDWVTAWREGRSAGLAERNDENWQRRLFSALADRIGMPTRAELRRGFLERVNATSDRPEMLQPRVSVFGISHMPPFHLEALAALRELVQVDIYALNPSGELWDYVVSRREADRLSARTPAASHDSALLHLDEGNSLLASMGRHGRDFFRLLHELEPTDSDHVSCEPDGDGATMLACIQDDVRTLTNPTGEPLPADPADRSIRFHSCHSAMREVEVLRDTLLDLLETDSNLGRHDILVMAPNIETYVPLVEAVFGATGDETALPYSIADRTLRHNRAVTDFLDVLQLPAARFRASRILRLLESQPVRDRFGIGDDELETIRRWVAELRVRWGIDGSEREAYGMPAHEGNTWQAGLDRLLLGYALRGDNELFGDMLPFENAAAHTDTLDRFLSFFEALVAVLRDLRGEHTAEGWSAILFRILDTLFEFGDDVRREADEVRTAVRELAEQASAAGFTERFSCDVVRDMLEQRLSRCSAEHGYLARGITFCSMVPMRSIPFKCICLLGMSDTDFPRREVRTSFDLMARNPRCGDREQRLDDRYQFLEALLSARRYFHVSYAGQDIQDNSPKPPSVCVLELRDYLRRRFGIESPQPCTVEHRLQAYNVRYFDGGDAELFSYSQENLRAAQALSATEAGEAPVFVPAPLGEAAPAPQLGLDHLIRFFHNPSMRFLQGLPGIELPVFADPEDDSEAFELQGLERYTLAEYLAAGVIERREPEHMRRVAVARGLLPHGTVGDIAFGRLASDVDRFAGIVAQLHGGREAARTDIDLDIAQARITARVPLLDNRHAILARYARVKGRDRIRAWLIHLLLCARTPDTEPQTTIVARLAEGAFAAYRYKPVTAAHEHLGRLLSMTESGLREPLPFFPETSYAFAEAIAAGKTTDKAYASAREAWEGGYGRGGESADAHFAQCFGPVFPRGTAFEEAALTFYGPLIAAESEVAP